MCCNGPKYGLPKLPFPLMRSGPYLTHGSLGPHPSNTWFWNHMSLQPKCTSIASAISPRPTVLLWSTNKQAHTHRPCYIGNNRLHLMLCIAMRPNNCFLLHSQYDMTSLSSCKWLCKRERGFKQIYWAFCIVLYTNLKSTEMWRYRDSACNTINSGVFTIMWTVYSNCNQ